MLQELQARRQELEAQFDRADISLEELADWHMLIGARMSSIDQRIMQIRARLRDRRLIASLGKEIVPLSSARANTMRRALEQVQQQIQATMTLKAIIKLASAISDAVTDSVMASTPETA